MKRINLQVVATVVVITTLASAGLAAHEFWVTAVQWVVSSADSYRGGTGGRRTSAPWYPKAPAVSTPQAAVSTVRTFLPRLFSPAGCSDQTSARTAWAVVGVVSLVAFAIALARVDTQVAGRAYAAYGGIYVAMALAWLWLSEGQRPTATDLLGAAVAVAGTLIILSPIWRR